ncbi:MAG: hypothetical protein HY319_02395 [Armatimonadetes bacterium]|nr:hypothetical protein [Armatimonadota bacterium]
MARIRIAITALLFFVILPSAAGAEVTLETLLVRRWYDNLNIRVSLHNPSPARQPGPVVVELSARANSAEAWIPVKTWNNINYIQPGFRVSRDFFEENSAFLRQLASRGTFEVRAVVRAPGQTEAIEKISTYNSESGE